MKPSAPLSPQDEAIASTAAAWMAERDDGLTPEGELALARWRRADPRHEAVLASFETTWEALQQLQTRQSGASAPSDRCHRPRFAAARRLRLPAFAAALAAMLAIGVGWRLLRPAAHERDTANFATGNGGYSENVLADGSVVELNADSEVSVHYTIKERRVQLVRGEAHFKVAKNKARPFWVVAGAVAVRAVGTEFDVSLQPAAVEVLVTEGRVQVDRGMAAAHPLAELTAREKAVVSLQRSMAPVRLETVSPESLSEKLAWEGPRLHFAETPLSEVASQFNRCNTVQLELADPLLASRRIGGSFQAQNVEGFVRLMASDGSIAVERPDAYHIVLQRAR